MAALYSGRLRSLDFSGQEYQLLEWLKEVTYPREAKFADCEYARSVYPSVVRRVINFGVRLFFSI